MVTIFIQYNSLAASAVNQLTLSSLLSLTTLSHTNRIWPYPNSWPLLHCNDKIINLFFLKSAFKFSRSQGKLANEPYIPRVTNQRLLFYVSLFGTGMKKGPLLPSFILFFVYSTVIFLGENCIQTVFAPLTLSEFFYLD